MKKRTLVIVTLTGFLAVCPQLFAEPTWCAANHPNSLLCEDWDRYCNPLPTVPERCADHSSVGWDIEYDPGWSSGASGCVSLTIEDHWFTSAPRSGRQSSDGYLGVSYLQLAPLIMKKFGNQYKQFMATDASPITMETVIDGAQGKILLANIYIELSASTKQPLTDHILSEDCATACGGGVTNQSVFPVVCRQSPRPVTPTGSCPPIETAPILPSIAAGAVAFVDPNSCHCEGTSKFPHADHLSVFDGKQWWILSQSLVPSQFVGEGDFKLYARPANTDGYEEPGRNHVRLTVNATEIFVELMKVVVGNPQAEYSWCKIPRQYLGPFAVLNFGYAEPCLLNSSSWECAAIRRCVRNAGGHATSVDNILIDGGIGYDAPGACCVTDQTARTITCVPANGGMDCMQNYGGDFKGPNTVCETTPCCPPFLPDHDLDGDVDLEDFGWFQTCLSAAPFADPPTVACQCANLDGDADIDTDDFGRFANCLSGPGVAANPSCFN